MKRGEAAMRKTLLVSVLMAAGFLGSSAMQARSESTNVVFWGRSICGASLRVTSVFKEYTIGKAMPITVCITNAGAETVSLPVEGAEYRLDLFESSGRPVEALNKRTGERPFPAILCATSHELAPGEEHRMNFMLDQHFAVKKAGDYYLIVQRSFIDRELKSLMSSLVIVRVVE
jgi:hypothetical protein